MRTKVRNIIYRTRIRSTGSTDQSAVLGVSLDASDKSEENDGEIEAAVDSPPARCKHIVLYTSVVNISNLAQGCNPRKKGNLLDSKSEDAGEDPEENSTSLLKISQ